VLNQSSDPEVLLRLIVTAGTILEKHRSLVNVGKSHGLLGVLSSSASKATDELKLAGTHVSYILNQ
jgi:hypothetical protein